MGWLKRGIWRAAISIAGLLLLLVLMVWFPASAGAYEGVSGLATPATGTIQAVPTEDATVTALNREKLALDVTKEKSDIFWSWTAMGTIIVGVTGVVLTIFQFLRNRRDAQDKEVRDRVEERFKTAVAALGDEKEGVQVGGAILLRSYLNPDDKEVYGRYYAQIFDLAVAYLRFPNISRMPEDPDALPPTPRNPNAPIPLTPLRQALITLFKEAFPLARNRLGQVKSASEARSLDASYIQLDNAHLSSADLKNAWLPYAHLRNTSLSQASLNGANLGGADLTEADLYKVDLSEASLQGAILRNVHLWKAMLKHAELDLADLSGANLGCADLSGASILEANLTEADLTSAELVKAQLWGANFARANLTWIDLTQASLVEANLSGADLSGAKLSGALLGRANLTGANLSKAKLNGAFLMQSNLSGADLSGADLSGADLDKVDLEKALSLKGTKLHGVMRVTKEQLEACKAKEAIIDEDTGTSPSQPPVSSSLPVQNASPQAPSTAPAQVSPPPATTGNTAAVSQQSTDGTAT